VRFVAAGAVPKAGAVQAAGALCWRRNARGGLDLLLVHSARWGDWSWPKGKREAGEPLPLTAVREVQEETGARIRLGLPLAKVSYTLPDGTPKRVHYWAGQVVSQGAATASSDEIAETVWLPAALAHQRLTRPSDLPALQRLLDLDEAGLLDTSQLIVVRHAKAVSRADWDGAEADRPLHPTGVRQTATLTSLLACWQPERLVTSPWARCERTLAPYAQAHALPVNVAGALTEASHHDHPDLAAQRVHELLAAPGRVVLCTHRPVLATVNEAIRSRASGAVRDQVPDSDPWLRPARILTVHHRDGEVSWVEKH
jgi:8-oxo-(d)GTP phosphatase